MAAAQYGAANGLPRDLFHRSFQGGRGRAGGRQRQNADLPQRQHVCGRQCLIELARQATKLLGGEFDIEIIEKHHHNKLDAPSGTALMIADAINAEADGRYEYVYDRTQVRQSAARRSWASSVRGGGIVGEHDVAFCGPDEVVTLSHSAGSRGVFC